MQTLQVQFSVHVNQPSGTQVHPEVYFHISLMHDCSFHSYLLLLHSDTLPVSIHHPIHFSQLSAAYTLRALLCVPSISSYFWFGCLVHFGPSLSLVSLSFLSLGLLIQNIPWLFCLPLHDCFFFASSELASIFYFIFVFFSLVLWQRALIHLHLLFISSFFPPLSTSLPCSLSLSLSFRSSAFSSRHSAA